MQRERVRRGNGGLGILTSPPRNNGRACATGAAKQFPRAALVAFTSSRGSKSYRDSPLVITKKIRKRPEFRYAGRERERESALVCEKTLGLVFLQQYRAVRYI